MKRFFRFVLLAFIFLTSFDLFSQAKLTTAEANVCREKIVNASLEYIGFPYKRGATGPDAFDCSGFIFYLSRNVLKNQLPRTTKALYDYVQIIPDSKRQPGDLVFFKTTDGTTISHVGLYLGDGEFISAISDGDEAGIKISSLNSSYWKKRYASSGKFLKEISTKDNTSVVTEKTKENKKSQKNTEISDNEENTTSFKTKKKSENQTKSTIIQFKKTDESLSFNERFSFSASTTIDWSLFTEKRFMPNFRGLTAKLGVFYEGKKITPGIDTMFRWNYGVGAFQFPILFSVQIFDFMKAYAGPVFTVGSCAAPDTEKVLSPSVFPGIAGVTFLFPSLTKKSNLKVQIIQDINYTFYNNTDGASLTFWEGAASGIEFSTGINVTIPLSGFIK